MAEWRSSSRKRKERAEKQRRAAERARSEEDAPHLREIAESPVFQRVAAQQRKSAGEILAKNSDHQGVVAAAVDALGVSDYLCRDHLKVLPPEDVPACREGCHYCCYSRVQASVAEIFLLAQWLQARKPAEELAVIRAKLREVAQDPRVMSLSDKPKFRVGCVLLKDGACGAYEARPLACRSFTSMDAERCRRALDDDDDGTVTADAFLLRVCNGAGQGLVHALADVGLGAEIVELTRALDIVLNEENVFDRWCAGEAVFEQARVE